MLRGFFVFPDILALGFDDRFGFGFSLMFRLFLECFDYIGFDFLDGYVTFAGTLFTISFHQPNAKYFLSALTTGAACNYIHILSLTFHVHTTIISDLVSVSNEK